MGVHHIWRTHYSDDLFMDFLGFLGLQFVFIIEMGNSKTKPAVVINVNKQFYFPGQQIQGNVFINALKPYPSSKIILTMTGHEKTHWQSSSTKNKKQTNEKYAQLSEDGSFSTQESGKPIGGDKNGNLKIIEKSYTLASWNDQYNIHGQYAFPFAFHLPSHLPATFNEQTSKYKASITYEMICTCISMKKDHPDLEERKEIFIRIPQKKNMHQIYGELFLRPKSCCFNQGVSKINCYFDKNQYLANEDCLAFCQIDNYKCKTSITEIRTKFKKVITLKQARGEQSSFIQQLNESKFPGIAAFAQCTGSNANKLLIPLKHKNSTNTIPPTTRGRLVNCEYQLELIPIVAGGCCSKNKAQFTVGIEIIQAVTQQDLIEAPADWNPQVFSKSNIYVQEFFDSNNRLENMNDRKY